MLVLTRRAGERLSFPEAGVTIHFLRIQAAAAKLGIEAPQHVHVVREESRPDAAETAEEIRRSLLRLPQEARHAIRNELHTVRVGLHLYREQLAHGLNEEAAETFSLIQDSLKVIEKHDVLKKPDHNGEAVPRQLTSVLLVEDDPNERELLAAFLRLRGFEIICVPDGLAAMEYLNEHCPPHVILLDMNMPGSNGGDTLHRIRSDERLAAATVFVVSGTSPEENPNLDDRDRIDHWFSKPVQVESLVRALNEEMVKS